MGMVERFLSGGSPTDPLYLSNRPWRKRAFVASAVAVPFVAVAAVLFLSKLGYLTPQTKAAAVLSPAELAQKMLPDLDKLRIKNKSVIDVVEVRFDHGADAAIFGTLKNNSNHTIHSGDAIFDLADEGGSQMGRFTVELTNMAPQGAMTFRLPMKERNAAYAFLREVNSK